MKRVGADKDVVGCKYAFLRDFCRRLIINALAYHQLYYTATTS